MTHLPSESPARRMRALNWREAFLRSRIALYALLAVGTVAVGFAERPQRDRLYWQCAAAVRNHVRDAYSPTIVDVFPGGYGATDEAFCRDMAAGVLTYAEAPRAQSVAAEELAKADGRTLTGPVATHATAYAGALLALVAVIEVLSRAFLWVLSGLFVSRS
jgi:hypothetical protein